MNHQTTKLKVGDKVAVIAGKNIGKTGIVEALDRVRARVQIQGVNEVKKHVKARGKQPSGIITTHRPIAISNVLLVCPACNRRTRIRIERSAKQKQRVCKQCEVVIAEKAPKS